MKIHHQLTTSLDLPLPPRAALAFVQDVRASLREVRFMRELKVVPAGGSGTGKPGAGNPGDPARVRAAIPVVVPLVGSYDLEFESALEPTPRGARLHALPPAAAADEKAKGWAEVSGEAEVTPLPGGSRVCYRLDLTVYVVLPEPEGWGGRALLKMVEVTAQKVIADVTQGFPEAVLKAARELEPGTETALGAQ